MTELADLNRFIDASRAVACDAQLKSLIADLCQEMGFDHFSLFRRSVEDDGGIAITDYPEGWLERVVARRYYAEDPVCHAARRTASATSASSPHPARRPSPEDYE